MLALYYCGFVIGSTHFHQSEKSANGSDAFSLCTNDAYHSALRIYLPCFKYASTASMAEPYNASEVLHHNPENHHVEGHGIVCYMEGNRHPDLHSHVTHRLEYQEL